MKLHTGGFVFVSVFLSDLPNFLMVSIFIHIHLKRLGVARKFSSMVGEIAFFKTIEGFVESITFHIFHTFHISFIWTEKLKSVSKQLNLLPFTSQCCRGLKLWFQIKGEREYFFDWIVNLLKLFLLSNPVLGINGTWGHRKGQLVILCLCSCCMDWLPHRAQLCLCWFYLTRR